MSSLKQAWATMVTDFRATSNVCSKIGLQKLQSKIGLQRLQRLQIIVSLLVSF